MNISNRHWEIFDIQLIQLNLSDGKIIYIIVTFYDYMANKSISFHQNIKHNFSRIHRNPESKQKEDK